jgi:hypothetical protein
VKHVRFQPAVLGRGSDEKRRCDTLGVRTANPNYSDSTFTRRSGYGSNRILFVHKKRFYPTNSDFEGNKSSGTNDIKRSS